MIKQLRCLLSTQYWQSVRQKIFLNTHRLITLSWALGERKYGHILKKKHCFWTKENEWWCYRWYGTHMFRNSLEEEAKCKRCKKAFLTRIWSFFFSLLRWESSRGEDRQPLLAAHCHLQAIPRLPERNLPSFSGLKTNVLINFIMPLFLMQH